MASPFAGAFMFIVEDAPGMPAARVQARTPGGALRLGSDDGVGEIATGVSVANFAHAFNG